MKASIIITSYNYAKYLTAAIESALAQTYPQTEVIIVDDGSEDNSWDVISGFGSRVRGLKKENGGQASAFNLGFASSEGDVVCFMDSDDLIMPDTIAQVVAEMESRPEVVKIHWPLWIINEQGRQTGEVMHRSDLAEGDVRDALISRGPAGYNWPSTSGNAWRRDFLDRVLPVPESDYRIGPDVYLSALVPLFGSLQRLQGAGGCYRIHGCNNTYRQPFQERIEHAVWFWEQCFKTLEEWCYKMGIANADIENWRVYSFWHRTQRAVRIIERLVPDGMAFILPGEDQWATREISGRRVMPFTEQDGFYWGAPESDAAAIQELERQRAAGASYLIFPWWTFWWAEYYPEFWSYLTTRLSCVERNEDLIGFALDSLEEPRHHA